MSTGSAAEKLRDFAALGKAMARASRERERLAREQAERERQAREHRRRAEAQAAQFALAVGPVHGVKAAPRADTGRPRPPPEPVQRERDERAALQEALSDEVDVETLLLTDDGLSFRRPGVGLDVTARLRRGHWSIQHQIDLHGLRRDEAREALAAFIREAIRRGLRCVRVIHGKGHGSPGRQPVLKARVQRWLAQCDEVVAFTQASAPQGGAGALIVLLVG